MKAETVTERTDPENEPGALRAAEGDGATEPGTVRETPDETPADTAEPTEADPQETPTEADSTPAGRKRDAVRGTRADSAETTEETRTGLAAANATPAERERPTATPRNDGGNPTETDAARETPADPRKATEETRTGLAAANATPAGRERQAGAPRTGGDGPSEDSPDPSDQDGDDDAGRRAPSWARTGKAESGGGSASDDAEDTPTTTADGGREDREPAGPSAQDGDGGAETEAGAAPASDEPEDERPAAPKRDPRAGETAAGAPGGVKGTSAAPARPEAADRHGDRDRDRDRDESADAAPATNRDARPEATKGGKAAATGAARKPDAGDTAPTPKDGKPGATAPRKPGAGAAATGGAPARRDGAGVESDSERTSQFVALKELGAPAGTKAAPATAAPRPGPEVTREAPLPPLELLAELTNTAPPPETPRRTLTRRVKVWTPIVLLLGGLAVGAQLARPLPAPRLAGGETSYTLEGNTPIPWPAKGQAAVRLPGTGDVATFGEQKPMPTASVAKVMTAYVILKGHPLRKNDPGPRIEVDAAAVADGKSEDESAVRVLTAGSKYSQLDMLRMMMIPSANNIARLLARWDSGSTTTDAFVAKMNAAAKELGMNDTTYTDPSGLDAGTVSTAADQLKLAEAVMKEEAFRPVVATSQGTVDGLPTPLLNNNASLLLTPNLNIRGIKTGSSTPAGGTLMWAAYKTVGTQDQLILGTMMDQRVDRPDPGAAMSLELVKENSRKVVEAVRAALAEIPAVRKGQPVGYVDDGLGGRTPLVATKDLSVIGVPGQRLKLSLGAGGKSLPHEAKAGTEVGVLTVGDGEGARSVPVAVGKDLVEPSFGTRVTRLS
ncbi:D-alanyl-D-alanine carboxypeptidase [Streptomyces lavendulae subsp. lavendulae]|uniref:serine hydrolase n=1 Tax=Streptomyces lavendulae TaxID=1914 RepID=UPI00249FBADF|nr:serine hydrolase [Streptomyces lavendulae]GLV82371.1 D-alanyl-D-alanine carboxypeptidase [Streptomyces lavendulae subsp. lavendulae]